MKKETIKRMYLLGISLSLIIPLFAQKPIEIEEIQCTFSHGEHPGLSLTIPEAEYDDVAKEWTKRLEKRTKSKITIENGEYAIFGALIPEISENPLNVYSILRSQDSAVVLDVSFEIKPKEFLSREQSEKEFALVRDHLFQFGKEEYSDVANEQLKEEEKKLRTFEKELSSLENEKSKLEKSIVEENNNILGNNDKIELLKADASLINEKLSEGKAELLKLNDEEMKKTKESQLKELEKNKKQVLKDIENLQKKTVDSESNIHTAELEIESNVNDQLAKIEEIDKQKLVVEAATNKLNTIMSY
jgi:hypothetical protein